MLGFVFSKTGFAEQFSFALTFFFFPDHRHLHKIQGRDVLGSSVVVQQRKEELKKWDSRVKSYTGN